MECEICEKSVFTFQQAEGKNLCSTCYDTAIAKQKAEGRYVEPKPTVQPSSPAAPEVPTATKFLRFFCGIVLAGTFKEIPWAAFIKGTPTIMAFLGGTSVVVGYYCGWKVGNFIGNKISGSPKPIQKT